MESKERLIDRLKGIRLLKNRAAESALRSVPRNAFLPPEQEALGDCDVPIPCQKEGGVRFIPSLRFMALLLEALDLSEKQKVAVVDSRGGYLAAAIAATMGGKGSVTAVELDLEQEEIVLKNLEKAHMSDMVEVMGIHAFLAKSSTFARVLLFTNVLFPRDIISQVTNLGFILSRGGPEGLALVRTIKSGDDVLEILFGDVRLIGPLAGPRGHDTCSDIDVSKVLGLEDIMKNVWKCSFVTEKEGDIAEVVKETLAGGHIDPSRLAKKDVRKLNAAKAFHLGYLYQSMGYLEDAEDLYNASLSLYESAEAHTFLGWRFSFDGRYEEAIGECKRAIEIDSSLGNPYNDIGAYLIEMGLLDEAIDWLNKALSAIRYCCYCYTHCNLGRVYMMKGLRQLAVKELEKALDLNPEYDLARQLLDRVQGELDYFA